MKSISRNVGLTFLIEKESEEKSENEKTEKNVSGTGKSHIHFLYGMR